jgi:general secretion pathway protein G
MAQKKPQNRTQNEGYTLTELLVVLVILGLLVGLIAPRFLGQIGKARTKTARVQISNLSTALDYYQLDTGRYPSGATGLSALLSAPPNTENWDGPYLKTRRVPTDPWGNPYIYQPGVGGSFIVKTLGADSREGGDGEDADISSADG